jgi:hypothetical protein
MSLIEQAAKRLEQLRKAGVEVTVQPAADTEAPTPDSNADSPVPRARMRESGGRGPEAPAARGRQARLR